MIIHKNQISPVTIDKPQGGQGHMDAVFYLGQNSRPVGAKFSMVAEMTLAPGAIIAYHIHPNDEEIYLLIKGNGNYIEHDRSEHPVSAGSYTFCPRGEGHGLINNTSEPLVFLAFIAD
jgi:quercetin dioxygenase-like cupin family protein